MRSRWVTLCLLMGAFALGTGASTEAVQQARDWQYNAEIARAGKLWGPAYAFYAKIAETFPDTRYGWVAARRARQMRARMLAVDRAPASEDPISWLEEAIDFVVWP